MKKGLILSILSICVLTSCAVSKENTYKYSDYNSPIFAENYYTIKEENIVNNIKSSKKVELDKTLDGVFESYDELKASNLDSKVSNDEYTYDTLIHLNSNTNYGTSNCLGNIDDSFNHGILSKLTDGLLFCDGITYQGVRVQINKDGFVHEYEKKCVYADYFALSFKAGSDFTSGLYSSTGANYVIKFNFKFYIEDGGEFIENTYSYETSIIRDKYCLLGFPLKQDMAKNLKGLGISYDLISTNEDASLDHCLHLYETLFVNSIWY